MFDMKKNVLFNFVVFVVALSCFTNCSPENDGLPASEDPVTLSIVDKQATSETKALLANLWDIQKKGFMFGHHADFYMGRDWLYDKTKTQSDTYNVCGDYPGVLGIDFAKMIDDRYSDSKEHNEKLRDCCLDAYRRGMVILACIHINNPLTGGDSWDNSSNEVAKEILKDGSVTNVKFKTWLDRLAAFANNLKGDGGELIPIIFRPFHEHTDPWSWWGSTCTTEKEYISLWRFTVEYLRDIKGVHNFLYAISPDMNKMGDDSDILYRYPGDNYVDFIGIDSYVGLNNNIFVNNLKALVCVSKSKLKPCGVTETGVEGFQASDYWSTNILAPLTGRQISMVVTWTNEYGPSDLGNHYFSVFPGHPSEKDFIKFFNNDLTFFCNDLPQMYEMLDCVSID